MPAGFARAALAPGPRHTECPSLPCMPRPHASAIAEDAWNSCDPERVSLAYTEDTEWRNRAEFLHGRAEVVEFLRRKWAKEHD